MSQDPILRALANCNPNEALEPTDPRFVDLDDIRGQALRKYLLKLLRAADSVEHYEKVAVAGNRGSGKSTELNRAETELQENGYVTLWASVNENLDPKEISFSDIIRLIVQLIDDQANDVAKGDLFRVEVFIDRSPQGHVAILLEFSLGTIQLSALPGTAISRYRYFFVMLHGIRCPQQLQEVLAKCLAAYVIQVDKSRIGGL